MFLALAHMVHATQVMGLGGDDNVPCACAHGSCYASHGFGGDDNVPCACYASHGFGFGGMIMFLALAHMVHATQVMGLGLGGG